MIAPMKKATVFALREDREALLLALQRNAIMMVVERDGSLRDALGAETEADVQQTGEALAFLKKYRDKPGFLDNPPVEGWESLMAHKKEAQQFSEEAHALRDALAAAKSEQASLESARASFAPWLPLRDPVPNLVATRCTVPYTGFIPLANREALVALEEEYPVSVEIFERAAGSYAALVICHRDSVDAVSDQLKLLGFVNAQPPAVPGTVEEADAALRSDIAALNDKVDALNARAAEIGAEADSVELLYDRLSTDLDRYNTPYSATEATFYLQGWVEAGRAAELDETLREATAVYELVLEDPAGDEKPPTLVRNNRAVAPFETLTDMFSRPNPAEGVDPNPAMAPWYWLLFGMMMADFGYGLLMALLFGLFIKIKKPRGEMGKLVRVLFFASITTAFWGVMFGSYFGAAWFPPVLMEPMKDPMTMLILCFALGFLHLATGMIVKAWELLRAGDIWGALVDQVAWILMIGGLCLMLFPGLGFPLPAAVTAAGKWTALAGAGVILLFSKRGTWNPLKRIGGGLLSLYNISGFLGDLLSYSRILALMLSSAVIAMVMNTLADMMQGGVFGWFFSIIIYIVGHLFNLVMGLLSAYVHASRLQYVEFFGKFYEGGGYAFKPLAPRTKYSVVIKENKK